MTVLKYVKLAKNGGAWPVCLPNEGEAGLEWILRYGSIGNLIFERYRAASIVASYEYLLSDTITTTQAVAALRELRATLKNRSV